MQEHWVFPLPQCPDCIFQTYTTMIPKRTYKKNARWKQSAGKHLRDAFVFVSQKCRHDNVQVLGQAVQIPTWGGLTVCFPSSPPFFSFTQPSNMTTYRCSIWVLFCNRHTQPRVQASLVYTLHLATMALLIYFQVRCSQWMAVFCYF